MTMLRRFYWDTEKHTAELKNLRKTGGFLHNYLLKYYVIENNIAEMKDSNES